jgi:hypothetical protein
VSWSARGDKKREWRSQEREKRGRIEREEGVQWSKGNEGVKYETKLKEGVKYETKLKEGVKYETKLKEGVKYEIKLKEGVKYEIVIRRRSEVRDRTQYSTV